MYTQHRFNNGQSLAAAPGKVVCVGRNYADHAKELDNPVPSQPLLFIKPATALAPLDAPIALPRSEGDCHHELEVALLIGAPLCRAAPQECLAAVAGYGLALDLTLRELQSELKAKGHPWERAKAFDGACPVSSFVPRDTVGNWQALEFQLHRNGQLQQHGHCADMLFPIEQLLSEISYSFSLQPGDVVLTGTPAGVGPLKPGDKLDCQLGDYLNVSTVVAG